MQKAYRRHHGRSGSGQGLRRPDHPHHGLRRRDPAAAGRDGLLHISQIANERVNAVTDFFQEGDLVRSRYSASTTRAVSSCRAKCCLTSRLLLTMRTQATRTAAVVGRPPAAYSGASAPLFVRHGDCADQSAITTPPCCRRRALRCDCNATLRYKMRRTAVQLLRGPAQRDALRDRRPRHAERHTGDDERVRGRAHTSIAVHIHGGACAEWATIESRNTGHVDATGPPRRHQQPAVFRLAACQRAGGVISLPYRTHLQIDTAITIAGRSVEKASSAPSGASRATQKLFSLSKLHSPIRTMRPSGWTAIAVT